MFKKKKVTQKSMMSFKKNMRNGEIADTYPHFTEATFYSEGI